MYCSLRTCRALDRLLAGDSKLAAEESVRHAQKRASKRACWLSTSCCQVNKSAFEQWNPESGHISSCLIIVTYMQSMFHEQVWYLNLKLGCSRYFVCKQAFHNLFSLLRTCGGVVWGSNLHHKLHWGGGEHDERGYMNTLLKQKWVSALMLVLQWCHGQEPRQQMHPKMHLEHNYCSQWSSDFGIQNINAIYINNINNLSKKWNPGHLNLIIVKNQDMSW